jgi:hypothetical protein
MLSPLPPTPEQEKHLQQIVNEKPLHHKPNLREKRILDGAAKILTKQAQREGESPSKKFEDLYRKAYAKIGDAGISPYSQSKQAASIIKSPTWVCGLTKKCEEGIVSEDRKRGLPKYPDVEHLTEQSSNSGGFHICHESDIRWTTMINVEKSVEGPVSATWPTQSKRDGYSTKHSTFFDPQFTKNEVASLIHHTQITPLEDYKSNNPLTDLVLQKGTRKRLERRQDPNYRMLSKSIYPVFRWLHMDSVSMTSEVPITQECLLGGQRSAAVSVSSERIEKIARDFLSEKKQYRLVSYINHKHSSVVVDIAKKIPEVAVERGIYLEIPVSPEILAEVQGAITKPRSTNSSPSNKSPFPTPPGTFTAEQGAINEARDTGSSSSNTGSLSPIIASSFFSPGDSSFLSK